jgi:hypothetical protein
MTHKPKLPKMLLVQVKVSTMASNHFKMAWRMPIKQGSQKSEKGGRANLGHRQKPLLEENMEAPAKSTTINQIKDYWLQFASSPALFSFFHCTFLFCIFGISGFCERIIGISGFR